MIAIEIENIKPHPRNPRKELGDLTELTDSIRTFGILQNMTVIPDEGEGYICLCGHRRLAAAKEAGLEEVPCTIVRGMSEKEQVSIMLLENMQRSDLTVQEEAQGLQMMLDLGSSIAEIVKETGLSETKVRHRVKMNELDQEILGEKLAAQVSINDLIKLESVKDIDKRNELLKMVGTNNFDWKYREALYGQKKEDTIRRIKKLKPDVEFAEGYSWQYKTVGSLDWGAPQQEVVDFMIMLVDKEEELGETAAIVTRGQAFTIGFKNETYTTLEEDPEEKKRREERNERLGELKAMLDMVEDSWNEFMTAFCSKSDEKIKEYEYIILDTLIDGGTDNYCDASGSDVAELIGEKNDDLETLQSRPWASIAAISYLQVKPRRYDNTWIYSDLSYDEDEAHSFIRTQEYLEILGYAVSDEERAFINGTSELYRRDEE